MLPNGIDQNEEVSFERNELWRSKERKPSPFRISSRRGSRESQESPLESIRKEMEKGLKEELKPSDSTLISCLKPMDVNLNLLQDPASSRAQMTTTMTTFGPPSFHSIVVSDAPGPKKWRFDKINSIKKAPESSCSPETKSNSPESNMEDGKQPSVDKIIGFMAPSKQADGREIYDFLRYEGSDAETPSKKPTSSFLQSRKKSLLAPTNYHREKSPGRGTLIVRFRESKMFFDYLSRGTPEDIKMVEKSLKEDPGKFLYDRGDERALANRANDIGQRPLYIAVKNGNIQMVRLLVSHGANPKLLSEIKLADGSFVKDSLLDAAARWNNIGMVEFLVSEFKWERGDKIMAASHTNSPAIKQALLKKEGLPTKGVLMNSLVIHSSAAPGIKRGRPPLPSSPNKRNGGKNPKEEIKNPKKPSRSLTKIILSCFSSKKRASHSLPHVS